jgi:hypothetical protein
MAHLRSVPLQLDANTTISALQNDLLVANETLSAVRLELQAQHEEAQSLRKVVAAAAERETESRGVLGSLQSAVHQLSTDAAAKSAAITQLQADLARLTDEATRNNVIRNNLQKYTVLCVSTAVFRVCALFARLQGSGDAHCGQRQAAVVSPQGKVDGRQHPRTGRIQ